MSRLCLLLCLSLHWLRRLRSDTCWTGNAGHTVVVPHRRGLAAVQVDHRGGHETSPHRHRVGIRARSGMNGCRRGLGTRPIRGDVVRPSLPATTNPLVIAPTPAILTRLVRGWCRAARESRSGCSTWSRLAVALALLRRPGALLLVVGRDGRHVSSHFEDGRLRLSQVRLRFRATDFWYPCRSSLWLARRTLQRR